MIISVFIDIKSIEPSKGSVAGGTLLTIKGRYFGSHKKNVQVKVAGINCQVKSVTPDTITCVTGAEDGNYSSDAYPGTFFVVVGFQIFLRLCRFL